MRLSFTLRDERTTLPRIRGYILVLAYLPFLPNCHNTPTQTIYSLTSIWHIVLSCGNTTPKFTFSTIFWHTFLRDLPCTSSWIRIQSISNKLDITFHVLSSQLCGHCDVISNRLWRHQKIAILKSFMDLLCHVRNKTCMNTRDELFMCSLECYFGVLFKLPFRERRNISPLEDIHYSVCTKWSA